MEKDKTNDSLEHCIVIKLAFVEVSLAVYQKKSFVCRVLSRGQERKMLDKCYAFLQLSLGRFHAHLCSNH